MPNVYVIPVLAGLGLLGAAAGVQLGHSAIAEIDPAYLHEPEVGFHADLVPYRSPDWAQVQAREYAQAQVVTQDEAVPQACVGCRTWPVEYVPRHDPTVDRLYASPAYDREYREARQAAPATMVVYEQPDPARQRIARYASYPVSREEAEAAAPAEQAPPAEDDAATQ